MALLDILVAPHPILKTKAEPVSRVTDEILSFMDSMRETMYKASGIGLAANQVGDLRRLVVVDCGIREEGPQPLYFINPVLEWTSEDVALYEEGCLSIPDLYAEIARPASIRVSFLDRDGKQQILETGGLLAICIQHEIDHLDGRLFLDHISPLKRDMMLRKLRKWKKDNGPIALFKEEDELIKDDRGKGQDDLAAN